MTIPGLNIMELVDAYMDNFFDHQYFLNLHDGTIVLLNDAFEDDDELHNEIEENFGVTYLRIPQIESGLAYRDMQDFSYRVSSTLLQFKLQQALSGPRPFRRFKDVLLDFPQERDQWFQFEYERNLERVREWLRDENITIDEP